MSYKIANPVPKDQRDPCGDLVRTELNSPVANRRKVATGAFAEVQKNRGRPSGH